jgi:hypothetical protein
MKSKAGKRKEEGIEDRLTKLHPKFINLIKDVQPIAFLASLCLIIATFSQSEFGNAQVYAIAAAFAFLCAFLSSILVKLMQEFAFAIMSYFFTGAGAVLLFLVTLEYAKINPVLSSVISLSFYLVFVMALFLVPTFYYTAKLAHNRLKKAVSARLALTYFPPYIGSFLMLVSSAFAIYFQVVGIKTPEFINILFFPGIALFIFGMSVVIIHEQRLKKKKKTKGRKK